MFQVQLVPTLKYIGIREEIEKMSTTAPKPFVFTLMPFDKKFDDIYKLGIKEAVNEAGGYCERVDEQIFEERMLDRVYNQINKADVIVADLTGRNPNVFYEVGYAHALEKRVILLTKNADDIPFDLKHHYHIVYGGSIVNLKDELSKRLEWYFENQNESPISNIEQLDFYINGQRVHDSALITKEVFHDNLAIRVDIHNNSSKSHNDEFNLGLIIAKNYDISLRDNLGPDPPYTQFIKDDNYIIISEIYIDNLFPDMLAVSEFPLENDTYEYEYTYNNVLPVTLVYYSKLKTHKIDFKLKYIPME